MSRVAESIETSETMRYLSNHISMTKMWRRISDASDDLIAKYSDILTNTEISKAKRLCWECNTPGEYANKFLVLVLMDGYSVFNSSHTRYLEILSAIKRENPRWVSCFINRHNLKLRQCKVSIYPLDNEVVESK